LSRSVLVVALAILLAGCEGTPRPAAGIQPEAPAAAPPVEAAPATSSMALAASSAPREVATAAPSAATARGKIIATSDVARRLARAIASDILLYNQDEVEKARRDKVVSEKLAAEIAEGRELFETRVAPELHGAYPAAIEEILLLKKAAGK
jgi:hypothetical protein